MIHQIKYSNFIYHFAILFSLSEHVHQTSEAATGVAPIAVNDQGNILYKYVMPVGVT